MKAIFSPGPSYSNPNTANVITSPEDRWGNPDLRKYAGWVRILDLYKEALEEIGCEVFIPHVPTALIDQSSTVSKILSYDVVAATQLPDDVDLFLGPPGYSMAQIMKLREQSRDPANEGLPKIVTYVWNNADWWRDQQLQPEYAKHQAHYDLSPTWRWINKKALELSDHVLACSPFIKWSHSKVVPADKISVAFWGVDSQRFTPAEHPPEVFRILFVGGDPVRKGLLYLMDALNILDKTPSRPTWLDSFELWVVGCAPFANPPPYIRQFGMVPNDQMPDIYRQCSIQVQPTLEDGISLCIQEGMACGLPAIASPDASEVFHHGVSGLIADFRDAEGIAGCLQMLVECRDSMGRSARRLAERQTWEQTKEDTKAVFRRMLSGEPGCFESNMPWLKGRPSVGQT